MNLNLSVRAALVLLSFMAILFPASVEAQELKPIAMQSEWSLNNEKLVTIYILYLKQGILFDITSKPDGTPVASGWGEVRGLGEGRLQINWQSGGVEVGKISNENEKQFHYAIEQHTDKQQVGLKQTFKKFQLSEEDKNALDLAVLRIHVHRERERAILSLANKMAAESQEAVTQMHIDIAKVWSEIGR